jgi:hypothetical protein
MEIRGVAALDIGGKKTACYIEEKVIHSLSTAFCSLTCYTIPMTGH